MKPQVAPIWENLFYGIINRIPLAKGYNRIKTFDIGGKIIAGQVTDTKFLKNGNTQKRITTVYPSGHLGLETKVYSPDGELLKAYAGIRTTSGTKQYTSATKIPTAEILKMHQSEKLDNAKILN